MDNNQPDLKYYWEKSISYTTYKEIITRRAEEGKNSPDEEIKEKAEYTHLNLGRIHRNDKTLVLEESVLSRLKNLTKKFNILVISEGWCGDAAQSVPVVNKLTENSSLLEMKVIFRDEDERLINQYLTNGAKSIPVVLILDAENYKEIAHWGPRPKPLLPFLQKYKANPETYTHDDFVLDLQNFYNEDKGHSIAEELVSLLR